MVVVVSSKFYGTTTFMENGFWLVVKYIKLCARVGHAAKVQKNLREITTKEIPDSNTTKQAPQSG